MKIIILITICILAVTSNGQTGVRTISVTIDDLPVVSTLRSIDDQRKITKDLLAHIKKAKIPAVGFVNESKLFIGNKRDEGKIGLLDLWLDAGLELGNHTYSHRSLNVIGLAEYQEDVIKGEIITRELIEKRNSKLRYFRHPFLQTGMSIEIKTTFKSFLSENGYTIAPVTHDNADYIFSRAYDLARDKNDKKLMKQIGAAYVPYMIAKMDYWERQSVKLFDREISQILLLHANSINARYLGELAKALKKRGYKFVDLETSLKDTAYETPDRFTRLGGISWLHRWAVDRGKGYVLPDEPLVPAFVMTASGFTSE